MSYNHNRFAGKHMRGSQKLKRIHLIVGALGLVGFLLQGQYMDLVHAHLEHMDDAPRMLYRSNHIYFLLTSLLNVVMGVYLPDGRPPVRPIVQWVTSWIVLLAPALIMVGFLLEPGMQDFVRPFTRPALYGLFGVGVVLCLSAVLSMRNR